MMLKTAFAVKPFLIALLMLLVQASPASAQRFNPFSKITSELYYGFETSFGVKCFTIHSNIPAVDNLDVIEEGGSIGLIIGNDMITVNAQAVGFFYSVAAIPHSIDFTESSVGFNLYPLSIAKKHTALQPFVSLGTSYARTKFFGHYLNNDKATSINYSSSEQPYLGKVRTTTFFVGGGVEYRIPSFDFLHMFAEFKNGVPLTHKADMPFSHTYFNEVTAINMGIRFGSVR